ncbi:hypothetical protein Aph02nite_56030 [Actinoplanes philippinensis]|nr:hypothetical protein Aph02nite_56030 [Actinoplanes philippinensis]
MQAGGEARGGRPEDAQIAAVGGHRQQYDVVPDIRLRQLGHPCPPPDGETLAAERRDRAIRPVAPSTANAR